MIGLGLYKLKSGKTLQDINYKNLDDLLANSEYNQ